MFCTTLRRRPSLAAVTAVLKSPPLSLRESQLNSHDLDIPFGSTIDQSTGNTVKTRRLRVLLISADETEQLDKILDHIQHFAALTGGRDVAIVFLLTPPPASGFVSAKALDSHKNENDKSIDGVYAYTKLQAEMVHHAEMPHVPILPSTSMDDIPRLLKKHVAALTCTAPRLSPLATSFDLLKLCTVEPMTQQTGFVLSDLFPNLCELSRACSSVTSAPNSSSPSTRAAGVEVSTQSSSEEAAGKLKVLRDLVGDEACGHVVDFWKEEWTID